MFSITKNSSILYKFSAWLIFLTKFLCGILSSYISTRKSCLNRKHKSTGRLGHCREMGRSNGSKPPSRDKHPYLLTLHIKFVTQPPTPSTAGDRTSLEGWQESLLARHFSLNDPSLRLKIGGTVCGHKTLSKTRQNARALRPDCYGIFVHQRNRSLCPRTPRFSIHLVKKGSKGPTCRISIKKKLSGRPSRPNDLDHCRETGMEN